MDKWSSFARTEAGAAVSSRRLALSRAPLPKGCSSSSVVPSLRGQHRSLHRVLNHVALMQISTVGDNNALGGGVV